jgi:hypothetical protein
LYRELTSNFKRLNLIYLGLVCLIDIGIGGGVLPQGIALPYFIASIGFCIVMAFLWVGFAVKNLLAQKKESETRGLIFLLQFLKWMGLAFVVFVIHSLLIWVTPINT